MYLGCIEDKIDIPFLSIAKVCGIEVFEFGLFSFVEQKRCSGAEFLHQVFDYLNLNEREFFGIQILPYQQRAEFIVSIKTT